MSIWEFRQWIESAVPIWVPFVIAGVVLIAIFVIRTVNRYGR